MDAMKRELGQLRTDKLELEKAQDAVIKQKMQADQQIQQLTAALEQEKARLVALEQGGLLSAHLNMAFFQTLQIFRKISDGQRSKVAGRSDSNCFQVRKAGQRRSVSNGTPCHHFWKISDFVEIL